MISTLVRICHVGSIGVHGSYNECSGISDFAAKKFEEMICQISQVMFI